MANYGAQQPAGDMLSDWLLGGNRKRQIIESLTDAPPGGWSALDLAAHLRIGQATVYEAIRALRGAAVLDVVDPLPPSRYKLASDGDLAAAIRSLVSALQGIGPAQVDRPPRTRPS